MFRHPYIISQQSHKSGPYASAIALLGSRCGEWEDHCKGGGGVERGGDPCGRPVGNRRSMLPLDF